ncbi:cysteine synthase A [Evansella caseinilytica]|uniref:Cysteine synthase A n=1 Tax=Evansella caseinilytica TaxID=1503961 RepID=A0A1H3L9N9_9BACI|nr:pyridoxal-phosphate dependent enzyme [Evansella caseinilytica]SDY61237.1 cysteine synthase A [Evansella caseinilytica]
MLKKGLSKEPMIKKAGFEDYLYPSVYRLKQNLYLLQFKVMKVLPAYNIIKTAFNKNIIDKNSKVIDTSSGTFALGLALVCNYYKLKLVIVSDPAMDEELKRRIEDLGANVIIVSQPDQKGNYQSKRLEQVNNIIKKESNIFWCKQYDNPDNLNAYKMTAELITKTFEFKFDLVGSIGSGGSTTGLIKHLRAVNSEIDLVGVDTFGSVLFGLPDRNRELRGLGNSVIPKNLDHKKYDEIHWISAPIAYYWTRQLHKNYALFSGPTTGASYTVANYLSSKNSDKNYVFIGPDDGTRYIKTVYNDKWLADKGYININHYKSIEPTLSNYTDEVNNNSEWTYMKWLRREL